MMQIFFDGEHAYAAFKETDSDGNPQSLIFGGFNNGWWLNGRGERIRLATQEEIDLRRSAYWGTNTP